MVSYEQAIKSLWTGKCTVTVRESVTDETTGRTSTIERPLLDDVACRISYDKVQTTNPADGAARVVQAVTLITDAGLKIPPGSKITVTQNGVCGEYEMSGTPAVYSQHQEIPLKIFGGWA